MADKDQAVSVRLDPDGQTSRVRLQSDLLARLDAIEAHHRGRGRRSVNRSMPIRQALERWLPEAEAEVERERR